MTKTQFRKKSKYLRKEVGYLIDDRIEKILKSGALDLDKYGDDYILPKIFICAMVSEIYFQFKPLSNTKEAKKEIKNIECFL